MKKVVSILLILSTLFIFASCGKGQEDDGKVLETAETYVELTGSAGTLAINESVVRTLLEIYPKESLGLSGDIYEYELKLSATRFMDKDACLVEAFSKGAEKPEGTFVVLEQRCFVYDKKLQKYLLLTPNGAVEFNSEQNTNDVEGTASTSEQAFAYDENNNQKLHELFDSYTKEQLGLEKEITEYILVASGTTTTASDDTTVFVIRLYEKNGDVINDTVAFNNYGNYMFDYELNRYKKIS